MKLLQLSLRDLFWLVALVAMGCGWWLERRAVNAFRQEDARTKTLLKRYSGETEIPPDLLRVYTKFVEIATTEPSRKTLEPFCLPHSVHIEENGLRPNQEYGQGIQVYFMKTRFSGEILRGWPTSDDTFFLRTGTSYLCFVKTSSGWKLYDYFDKPIA